MSGENVFTFATIYGMIKEEIHTYLIGQSVYISRISALIGIDNRKLSLVLHIKAEWRQLFTFVGLFVPYL